MYLDREMWQEVNRPFGVLTCKARRIRTGITELSWDSVGANNRSDEKDMAPMPSNNKQFENSVCFHILADTCYL